MNVDGRSIAKQIYQEITTTVSRLDRTPKLTAITCAPNFETQKYLKLKQLKAQSVGIELTVVELPKTATTASMAEEVQAITTQTDGIVIQLPIPPTIDRDSILSLVPVTQDPDGFSYGVSNEACLPPVVGAVVAIAQAYEISFFDKQIVILGGGRLVGKPMAQYLHNCGITPLVFSAPSPKQALALKQADIIITGIGQPEYLAPDMVKDGVVIFDAGTSEDGGELRGDVHPDVASKATLLTPVPGGIGPVTIAVLLQNLVSLVLNNHK